MLWKSFINNNSSRLNLYGQGICIFRNSTKTIYGDESGKVKTAESNREEHPTQQLHVSLELESERAAVETEGWEPSKCVKAETVVMDEILSKEGCREPQYLKDK